MIRICFADDFEICTTALRLLLFSLDSYLRQRGAINVDNPGSYAWPAYGRFLTTPE